MLLFGSSELVLNDLLVLLAVVVEPLYRRCYIFDFNAYVLWSLVFNCSSCPSADFLFFSFATLTLLYFPISSAF